MAMSRAQMEEQIKGLQGGGDVFRGYLTPVSSLGVTSTVVADEDEQARINRLKQEQIDRIESERDSLVEKPAPTSADEDFMPERQKAFSQNMEMYKKELEPLLSSTQRPTFFDLASDLGAAMLSAPADSGAFTAAGQGFVNFNERVRTSAEERRGVDQQIALKAFELAREDEQIAQEYLNDITLQQLKLLDRSTSYEMYEYDYVDPSTGETSRRQIPLDENNPADMALIRGYTTKEGKVVGPSLRNAQRVKTPSTVLDMGGQGVFEEQQGKALSAAITDIGKGYSEANSQTNLLDMVTLSAANLGDEGLGTVQAGTLGARKFLSDIGLLDAGEKIADQELLQTLGTRLAMQLIGLTKGAITEMEMRLFISASPGLASTAEGLRKQIDFLKRISNLKKTLYKDYYADENLQRQLADPSINDIQRSAIFNRWKAGWHSRNKFLTPDEEIELRRLALEENAVAQEYRRQFKIGQFDVEDEELKTDVSKEY